MPHQIDFRRHVAQLDHVSCSLHGQAGEPSGATRSAVLLIVAVDWGEVTAIATSVLAVGLLGGSGPRCSPRSRYARPAGAGRR